MNEHFEEEYSDAVFEYLAELFQRLPKESVKLLNPHRYKQMLHAASLLTTLLQEDLSKGEISVNVDSMFNMGSIIVELEELTVCVPHLFSQIISEADNFEIYPLSDGKIRFAIVFHSVLNTLS